MREQMKTGNHLLFGQLVLHLAVLGEVHGGDLFSLLHLALVGLDLGLELLNEILHALHVLAVLFSLECEFFESSVGLSEVLAGLGVAALFGVELGLEFADAGLQLGNDALASLEGGGLSLVKTSLKVLDGDFELLAESVTLVIPITPAAHLVVAFPLMGLFSTPPSPRSSCSLFMTKLRPMILFALSAPQTDIPCTSLKISRSTLVSHACGTTKFPISPAFLMTVL